MNEPNESVLAALLHKVYRKWAGIGHLGDHLPETWNAVADAALGVTDTHGGAALIANERIRQVTGEGWSLEHDDKQNAIGELALAAIAYASPVPVHVDLGVNSPFWSDPWPWGAQCDKRPFLDAAQPIDPRKHSPETRIALLVKAGALIAAEIDRLRRAQLRGGAR